MLPLPQQAEVHLEKRAHDLELLLMPAEQTPEITSALLQGSGFRLLRQRKRLSLTQATHLMGRDEQVIAEIEEGKWSVKATLADYWRYTEILGCSLTDVIEAVQTVRSNENERRLSGLDERTWLRLSEVAETLRRSLIERD
jgi:predicted transcriptional regulator